MKFKIIILITTLVFIGCRNAQAPTEEKATVEGDVVVLTEAQLKNAGVETGIIEKRTLNSELLVNGMVDVPPQNIVSVSFPLGGYLKTTKLLPGMRVNRGETIGIMEDPALVQLQQDYLMAKSRLAYLEKDLERQRLLNENKVNADKVYQQAQSDFQSQKILVRGYGEKLKLIGINPEKLDENNISRSVPVSSPITGFVSKVNVNIGKYVNPADVLFELINPDDMHAALTVFEKDIARVKPKQQVLVTFVDEPDRLYECEVLLVTRNVDADRSALVHCHFEKQPDRLLPGMFLNARIKIGNQAVLAVPEEAVVRFGKSQYVLLAEANDRFRLLEVVTGIKEGGMLEISSSSQSLEGLRIITRNPYPVLSKLKNKAEAE